MILAVATGSSRFWLWRLPAAVGAAATLLFAAGFVLAFRGAAGRPLGAPPPEARAAALPPPRVNGRLLLVLGDSLARGTGDESGRGFAADVLDGLRKRGPVEIANLGINGAESDEVRDLSEKPNVRSLAANAAWILVSVGGNDLSHAVPRTDARAPSPLEDVARARDAYAGNLRAILAGLREANPRAPIRLLALYDPFESVTGSTRLGKSVILNWNAVAQETALSFPNVVVVPTLDLFEGREDRLAIDHFHPNREGYGLIATRFLQVLE